MNNLPILLEISIHWAVWLSLYYLLLHKKTFFNINRWYLLLTLLLSIVIPIAQPFFSIAEQAQLTISLPEIIISAQGNTMQPNTPTTNWLSIIYKSGLFIFSAIFLFNISKIAYQITHLRKQKKSNYTIIELPENTAPFSFFNYIFISPQGNYTSEEWAQIIIHETTHARLFHSIDMLLLEIMKVIFWWNPMVYFYKIALRDVHEFQADQATTQKHNKKEYSRLLFRQSQSGMQTAITSNFIHSQLKKRIKMMMTKRSNRSELFRYLMILPLLTILFFVSCQQESDSQEVAQTVAKQEAKKTSDEIQQLAEEFKGKEKTPENKAEFQRRAKELIEKMETSPNFKKNRPGKSVADDGTTIYKAVQEMPQFQGCDEEAGDGRLDKCSEKAMLSFIYTQIKYPQTARDNNVQGRVIASFIVNKKGKLEKIKILRGIGSGCDEEVIRILELMNTETTWTPGRQDNAVVNVQYILPVNFKLE